MNTVENLTIGGLAKAAGVNVETIRYYQRRGLLPEPPRLHGQIRRYGQIASLQQVERVLANLVDACQHHSGNIACPLIDSLFEADPSKS